MMNAIRHLRKLNEHRMRTLKFMRDFELIDGKSDTCVTLKVKGKSEPCNWKAVWFEVVNDTMLGIMMLEDLYGDELD